MASIYEKRGASSQKKDVKNIVSKLDAGAFPGAFCKIVKDIFNEDPDRYLVQHSDGVGTKSILAYLMYKEYGDISYFKDLAIDSLVMNLDDMLAVGCSGPFLLNNVIGRNAKLIDEAILREVINGYTTACEHLQRWGINIIPAGGETADCGDLIRTLVVDSTLVCTLKKDDVIDCSKVKPNQVIIGFSSYGQTYYESSYNSGVSTNGFTFLRHELLNNSYGIKYPEILCPEVSADSYQGEFSLDTVLPGGPDDLTLGKALLSPTRTYMPFFVKIPSDLKSRISAIFHNTGGGLTKCLSFGSGISFIKDNLFDKSPLFSFIRKHTQTPYKELCQILNMGHRLEVVCDKAVSSDLIAIADELNLDAKIIGQTREKQGDNSLTVHHEDNTIEFNPG